MHGASNRMQRIDQGCEIMDRWLATGYHYKISFRLSDLCR
jgi:hypothetical protein